MRVGRRITGRSSNSLRAAAETLGMSSMKSARPGLVLTIVRATKWSSVGQSDRAVRVSLSLSCTAEQQRSVRMAAKEEKQYKGVTYEGLHREAGCAATVGRRVERVADAENDLR